MNARTLRLHAYPAFLTGTARQPLAFRGDLAELALDDETAATLNALSLTAQALRFEHPAAPSNFALEPVVEDPRAILAGRMRRPLLRLLNNRKPSDDLSLALAWAFARHNVRPHPFDLPKMDVFVRAHAELLGPTAQHWAQQQSDSPALERSYFDAGDLDEATWTKGTPARRARFIRERRGHDATAARAMVEAVWAQETADARVRLLTALEGGLSADDRPFLESIAKDRAPRVRALARRYLGRITGESGGHPALAACFERIHRSTTGLLKKRPMLALESPATIKEHEVSSWIRETFSEVSCDELARALELTEPAMIDAAEKDPHLLLACACMASQDRRFDLLEQLAGGPFPDAWQRLSQCGPIDLTTMTGEERARWARILIGSDSQNLLADYPAWSWLHRALEGPAPDALIESVLRSNAWLGQLLNENIRGAEWMEILAALCPSTQRERLRAIMAPVDSALTLSALPLLDILDSLEKREHHEQ